MCRMYSSVLLTHPVLGEERRSDTWYIPLVLPEMLEFLWRERERQRKQRVGSNVLLRKCPVSPSFSNIILQADLFFMIEKCEHTYFTKIQQDI